MAERDLEPAGSDREHTDRAGAAGVWLSEPRSVLPGRPNIC